MFNSGIYTLSIGIVDISTMSVHTIGTMLESFTSHNVKTLITSPF